MDGKCSIFHVRWRIKRDLSQKSICKWEQTSNSMYFFEILIRNVNVDFFFFKHSTAMNAFTLVKLGRNLNIYSNVGVSFHLAPVQFRSILFNGIFCEGASTEAYDHIREVHISLQSKCVMNEKKVDNFAAMLPSQSHGGMKIVTISWHDILTCFHIYIENQLIIRMFLYNETV